MIVLFVEWEDRTFTDSAQVLEARWRERLFTGTPSVREYYKRMSDGRIELEEVRFVHMGRFPNVPGTDIDESRLNGCAAGAPDFTSPTRKQRCEKYWDHEYLEGLMSRLLARTDGSGRLLVDLTKYDTHPASGPDGIIDEHELLVLVVTAAADDGAAARGVRCTTQGAKQYCPAKVAAINQENSLANTTHEMGHVLLGMPDLYFNGLNGGTLAGPTGANAAVKWPHLSYPLDPWLRALYGFAKPRFVPADGPSQCFWLSPASEAPEAEGSYPSFVAYDPRVGPNGLLFGEFRLAGSGPYDSNASTGLALWDVDTSAPGTLTVEPALLVGSTTVVPQRLGDDRAFVSGSINFADWGADGILQSGQQTGVTVTNAPSFFAVHGEALGSGYRTTRASRGRLRTFGPGQGAVHLTKGPSAASLGSVVRVGQPVKASTGVTRLPVRVDTSLPFIGSDECLSSFTIPSSYVTNITSDASGCPENANGDFEQVTITLTPPQPGVAARYTMTAVSPWLEVVGEASQDVPADAQSVRFQVRAKRKPDTSAMDLKLAVEWQGAAGALARTDKPLSFSLAAGGGISCN